MAERRARRAAPQVFFDYTFDRLLESKPSQVYDILVPGQQRLIGAGRAKEPEHEDGSHLRSSVLPTATRGTHDCEPDSSTDRVCQDAAPTGWLRRVLLHLSYSITLTRFLDTKPPQLFSAAARISLRPAPESRPRGAHPHLPRSFTTQLPVQPTFLVSLQHKASRPTGLHRRPLTERCGKLSLHTAPIR